MNKRGFLEGHGFLKFLLVILILAILSLLGFKLYLYVKYLIGNDIVIRLDADNRDLSLVYGQSATINFEFSRVTSPFCTTRCEYSFLDISNNITLDKNNIGLSIAQKKEETISQTRLNHGQEIYRFSLICRNVATVMCHTNELPVSRDVLVTVEYGPNEEQKNEANLLSQRVYSSFNQTEIILSNLVYLQSKIIEINKTLTIKDNFDNSATVSNETTNNFLLIKNLWKNGDYNRVNETLSLIDIQKNKLSSDFKSLNNTLSSKLEQYNSLVDVLGLYVYNLKGLSKESMNQSDALILDGIISNFNVKIDLFSKTLDIQEKKNISLSILENDVFNFSFTNGTSRVSNAVNFNLSRIVLLLPNVSIISQNFVLEDPVPECCVYNNCKACGEVDKAYPVLFIHGHDFNQGISAEYSLNAFQSIQNKLDSEGYLNAGQLTLYDVDQKLSGRLGLAGVPVTVRSTYYYDVLKESSSSYLPVQVKSENIDTYAIKLRTLVDKLKYETGQPRVIIVSHSMGGLVARRYVQLFGNDSVDKLIMIGTPNNGVEGSVVSYCSLVGSQAECNDLAHGSLLLNKLNNDPTDYVKTYNIIGTGCDMNGEQGDGIVLNKNAVLESSSGGVKELYVNGSCSGLDILHGNLLDVEKYPQVEEIIKNVLDGEE
ncbi:MAG: alpha/beta fold hydrolase [archaeon]